MPQVSNGEKRHADVIGKSNANRGISYRTSVAGNVS